MNDYHTVWHKNVVTIHSPVYKPGCHEAIVLITEASIKQLYCCFFIMKAWIVITVNKYKLLFHIMFSFFLKTCLSEGRHTWERTRKLSRAEGWGRETPQGDFLLSTELDAVRSQEPKITTWADTKSRTLNQLSHPGAPEENNFLTFSSFIGHFRTR